MGVSSSGVITQTTTDDALWGMVHAKRAETTITAIDNRDGSGVANLVSLAGQPVVDLSFPVVLSPGRSTSTVIPVDHGYLLFSAVSRILPFLHGNESVAIHPIQGRLAGNRQLQLTPHSAVTLRLSTDAIGPALPLAGITLDVHGAALTLGAPNVAQLIPAALLRSRVVIIKGMLAAEELLAAALSQLDALGIAGTLSIPARRNGGSFEPTGVGSHDQFQRRTVQIRDKVIVGYAMTVEGLTAEESICLQENGIGGRQRFGCGVFLTERFGHERRSQYE